MERPKPTSRVDRRPKCAPATPRSLKAMRLTGVFDSVTRIARCGFSPWLAAGVNGSGLYWL
jgi:hypothetical protein